MYFQQQTLFSAHIHVHIYSNYVISNNKYSNFKLVLNFQWDYFICLLNILIIIMNSPHEQSIQISVKLFS